VCDKKGNIGEHLSRRLDNSNKLWKTESKKVLHKKTRAMVVPVGKSDRELLIGRALYLWS
jgi:hypothetical protein